jgi:ribosomal protein L37AE/L43A
VPVEALAVLVEQCEQAPCPKCSVLLLYLRTQRTVWCQACGKLVTR